MLEMKDVTCFFLSCVGASKLRGMDFVFFINLTIEQVVFLMLLPRFFQLYLNIY